MKYYAAIKRTKLQIHVTTQMCLNNALCKMREYKIYRLKRLIPLSKILERITATRVGHQISDYQGLEAGHNHNRAPDNLLEVYK